MNYTDESVNSKKKKKGTPTEAKQGMKDDDEFLLQIIHI
jgi:hypothetical protein